MGACTDNKKALIGTVALVLIIAVLPTIVRSLGVHRCL